MDGLLAAAAPLLASAFTLWGSPVTWLEIVAFALSLAMVWFNLKVNPAAWPLAIIASLLYALLFAQSGLYGEASLQFVFVVVSVWGWRQWLRRGVATGPKLRVGWMVPGQRIAAIAGTLIAWPLLAMVLMRWTDSQVPWLDALPTVASITGQILLGRKRVENWIVWLGVNIFSVGLFAYKGLWLTVLLYGVFAVLSVVGWREWRRLATAGGDT